MNKIKNLTNNVSKGWYEVGYFCTNNPNEKITIVAKFKSCSDAIQFADWYDKTHAGITEIIMR